MAKATDSPLCNDFAAAQQKCRYSWVRLGYRRKPSDDVVDAGLTAIFGPLLGDPTHKVCNNFALPLCTDNVADPMRHTDAFPYLKPPA